MRVRLDGENARSAAEVPRAVWTLLGETQLASRRNNVLSGTQDEVRCTREEGEGRSIRAEEAACQALTAVINEGGHVRCLCAVGAIRAGVVRGREHGKSQSSCKQRALQQAAPGLQWHWAVGRSNFLLVAATVPMT